MENSSSKEYILLKPSPDGEAVNDTDTADGSSETQAANRNYLALLSEILILQ